MAVGLGLEVARAASSKKVIKQDAVRYAWALRVCETANGVFIACSVALKKLTPQLAFKL